MAPLENIRLRIAYFSPLPPVRSGIADYSSELLPYLAEYADITLFSSTPHNIESNLTTQFLVKPLDSYPREHWQYDMALYQMGNSAYHAEIYKMLLSYSGIVVLHDYSLHQFIAYCAVHGGNIAGYVREAGYELGQQGINYVKKTEVDHKNILNNAPLNKRLIDSSLGIITHSKYAKNLILEQAEDVVATVIPQQIAPTKVVSRRHQLGWPDNAVIFASAGQIATVKQVHFALHAFQKVRQTYKNAYYLIVGEDVENVDLLNIAQSLGLSDFVRHVGYIKDKEEFIEWIYTADVIINLRHPTIGETSAIALRALAVGRPLILFDHGWYHELPDSVCIKVPPLNKNALVKAMLQLIQQPEQRMQLGKAGKQLISDYHHPAHAARAYIEFIRQQLLSLHL